MNLYFAVWMDVMSGARIFRIISVLWFCYGPISPCVDLFVFICVYFVCFCFNLHSCCIIVSTVGWT